MARRSLQASTAGIQQARRAYNNGSWTQEALAEQVNLKTRQPISKFFAGKSIDRHVFIEVCTALELNWEDIAQGETTASNESLDLDSLVQAVREQIKPLIKERCGTMRVLDMTQPIALTGEQGIYTNVNILEKITGRRRLGIEELLQGCNLEEFDRFGLSRVTEKRVPGLEAVKRYSKLMVLGKPGAGKTTFLKYLAMQCIEGSFQADRIPVFITLKSFAEDENQPDLLTCLERLMVGAHAKTNHLSLLKFDKESFQSIIQQGKLLILLDGLDEVREEDTNRVLRQIRDFSEQFYGNHFVITCRIAAKEYTFEKFIEVEVADFDDEQICTFVGNWFRCREPENAEKLTQKLIKKLEKHEPIKELATNPLLLTLLCLEFEELLEFPTNRADLYGRGLGVLLSKWDATRRIERDQVYKRLSLQRKEDLLSQVALTTFEQKDYFFKQKTVESYIADYIRNLPDAQTDPEALLLNSEAVLKSIEGQHGLLIERARGIYSFSHLTFQEYFTAREIVTNSALETLISHLSEKHWREVVLLSVGMLRNADGLLRRVKQSIDRVLATDEKLQQFLHWVNQKTCFVHVAYRPVAIRALYFSPDHAHDFNLDPTLKFDLYVALGMGIHGDLASDRNELGFDFDHTLPLALDRFLTRTFDDALDPGLNPTRDHNTFRCDNLTYALTLALDPLLKRSLQNLKDQLPHPHSAREVFKTWWKNQGLAWAEQLRAVMIEHRNIGHDWQFSNKQKQLLQQYYDGNKLLVDCLNSDCYVSREVRQEIEDTLFLPIAEIEKYKAAKAAQSSN
jgi:predicted NACHT family NTPase